MAEADGTKSNNILTWPFRAFKKVSDKVGKPLTLGGLILIPFLIVVPGAWALANPVSVATMAPVMAAFVGFLNFYTPLFDLERWGAGLELWGTAIASLFTGAVSLATELVAPGFGVAMSGMSSSFGTAALGTSAVASTTLPALGAAGAEMAMNAGSSLFDAGTSITSDFMSNMAGSGLSEASTAALSNNFAHEAGSGLFSGLSSGFKPELAIG